MTARLVVSCDGTFDGGRMPCRGAYPAHTTSWTLAVAEAVGAGWSHTENGDDLCPAHTLRGEASPC